MRLERISSCLFWIQNGLWGMLCSWDVKKKQSFSEKTWYTSNCFVDILGIPHLNSCWIFDIPEEKFTPRVSNFLTVLYFTHQDLKIHKFLIFEFIYIGVWLYDLSVSTCFYEVCNSATHSNQSLFWYQIKLLKSYFIWG